MNTTMIRAGRTDLRITTQTYTDGGTVTTVDVFSQHRYPRSIASDIVKSLGGILLGSSVIFGRAVAADTIIAAARAND